MENLTFIHRGQSIIRKITGGFWILLGVIRFLVEKNSLDERDWLICLTACLFGIIFFTPLVGYGKTQIGISEGCLNIIWINRIRKIKIPETDIENIILSGKNILISRKGKKALKLELYSLSKEQKTKIYEFMIEYARLKNLVLEK